MGEHDQSAPGQSADAENQQHKPAGGWAALTSSVKHTLKQKGSLQIARALLQVNQPDGFDCPGCAWPDPKDASAFEFCENGAKAVAWEATHDRVGPAFFAEHTVADLRQRSDHWLEAQGRLTEPMRYDRATDRYRPVSWGDAFALIGDHLKTLDDPDQAVFYTSGRTSNEAAFLYQLLGRKLGTNNFPDCSNMCHESSGVALTETIGVGKGTVTLEDFDHADMILVIGQNPGTNHPRMLTELQKAAKRGAKIVSVNPMRERGLVSFLHPQHAGAMMAGKATPISSRYLQVTIGGDLAVLKGVCKLVLDAEADKPGEVLDHAFIREHTHGFDAFADDIRATSWDQITEQSGLSREQLQALADDYLTSERVIVCWAMGLTQHKHAVPTIQMAVNLLLLRGNLGRPGAGACPVRGHSNVQGDRTMGIIERPSAAFLDKLGEAFAFSPPTKPGLSVVHAIEAMGAGRVGVFIAMGGNFAAATPDTDVTARAIERCGLTVQVSTKLNRSHTVVGEDALILPCLGRTDRDETTAGLQRVTVEDSMSMVHASAGKNMPLSSALKSEPAIVAGIAQASLGPGDSVDWQALANDYSLIRDKIEQVIPGFDNFNKRIEAPGGFYLGNSARDRAWATGSQRANFTPASIPNLNLPDGQLRLMTLRSHDQYNTTVYGMDDRYRGVKGKRKVVFLHPQDLQQRGLSDGDRIDLTSQYDDGAGRRVTGFEAIAYDLPRGCAAGYFPELNPLVSLASRADRSHTPASKFIPITVTRSDA